MTSIDVYGLTHATACLDAIPQRLCYFGFMRIRGIPQELNRAILKEAFRENVERDAAFRRLIQSIPKGRVSSYGRIAAAAGYPLFHRAVAQLLRRETLTALPWQRIVGSDGEIRLKGEFAAEQRLRLKKEGVKFGGKRIDMKTYEHPLRSWENCDEL